MSKGSFSILAVCGLLWVFGSTLAPPAIHGQPVPSDPESRIAERFMQVLMRRPGPGTALDRVYAFHVQAGTLDQLMMDLRTQGQQGGEQAGACYMLLGLLQLQRGHDEDAASTLAKAEELRSDDAMASFYHAKALLLLGHTDAAVSALERATERRPPRSEAVRVFTQLGRLYQRGQQTEKALSVWQRLEAAFPGDARVSELIAQTLSEEGQHEAALSRYLQLAEKSEDTDRQRAIGYRVSAAELKHTLGRSDEARADLEALLRQLRPASWLHGDVRRRIDAGLLRGGDYAALADYYDAQVKQNPGELELRMRLGQTLAKAGRLNEAETTLRKTVELAPQNADARVALADVLLLSGKANLAARQLERLVEQDSENPDYLVRLGNTWLEDKTQDESQRRQAAAEAWQRLADAGSHDAVVTAQVADLMRKIERTEDALALYRRAIELAPDQPQYREYLGEYLHKLDRQAEALTAWEAIAAGPRENRENLIRLAEVFHTFGHQQRALDAFARAADLDPTFGQRLRYAELLSRAQQYDDSLHQFGLAEQVAGTPAELDQLLEARLVVYQLQGTLRARIDEARQRAENSDRAGDYRHLALMLDAASQPAEATAAIELAIAADPQDTSALACAAELYRKTSRYSDAIETYRTLAKLEKRFQQNYLKRIASLQMELGNVDQALATAEDLIAAQPGNPESHRFYAGLCFRAGRDEDGIDRLRLAVRVAPRDDSVRRALAQALANQYRTDEAIELYWQLLDEANELADESTLTVALADLYQRKGEVSLLVERLRRRGREKSDVRTAIVLASVALRATDDLGTARELLQQLVDENPRDVDLLRRMVDLSEAIGEPYVALRYQQQLTELADTPEHRNRLLLLLVESGEISEAEASLQRMPAGKHDVTLIRLIDRTFRRGEVAAAIRFCRAALQRNQELWEVRARLAAYLFLIHKTDAALAEADKVETLGLPPAMLSELQRASGADPSKSAAESLAEGRLHRSQQVQLYLSALRSASYPTSLTWRTGRRSVFSITDYSHARFLTLLIRLAAADRDGELGTVAKALSEASHGDGTGLESLPDVDQAWNAYDVAVIQRELARSSITVQPALSISKRELGLRWRLATVDATARGALVYGLLADRHASRAQRTAATRAAVGPPLPAPDPAADAFQPLDDAQLNVVRQAYQASQGVSPPPRYAASRYDALLPATYHDELLLAGRQAEAEALRQRFDPTIEDPQLAAISLDFYRRTHRIEELKVLVASIAEQLPEWAPKMSVTQQETLASALIEMMGLTELPPETTLQLADLAVASHALVHRQALRSPGTGQTGTATVNALARPNVPMSSRTLSSSMAIQFYEQGKFLSRSDTCVLLTDHLQNNVSIFPVESVYWPHERKLRHVLATFSRWWLGDVAGAYESMVMATEQFSDDDSLWIERARLASELGRAEAALEALDRIETSDHLTMQIREMAALNLAPRLGRVDRATTAAQRLFGMRLNKEAEKALADQLTRLGMPEMAEAVLRRLQGRGGQSAQDLLSLADRYHKAKAKDAAGEAAFGALQRLSGRTRSSDVRNRARAISLLRSLGRLDQIIEDMEQRVAAAPNSIQLKLELAELYVGAGKRTEADRIHLEVAQQTPQTPRKLWEAGDRLYKARKYEEALEKYVQAIKRQPSLLPQNSSAFRRAVSGTRQSENAFAMLLTLDLGQLDRQSVIQLASLFRGSSRSTGTNSHKFFEALVRATPADSLGDLLSTVAYNKALQTNQSLIDAVRRTFANDRTYLFNSTLWQAGARSSSGNLIGALDVCLIATRRSEPLQKTARELISARLENAETSQTARMLLLLLDTPFKSVAEIDSQTSEMMASNLPGAAPYFWWQAGQAFEQDDRLQPLALKVFEYARSRSPDTVSNSYTTGLGAKLITMYTKLGDNEKARRELVRFHESIVQRIDNQVGAPSYQDYRDIQNMEKIATNLIKVDARLDAMRVYGDALSRPRLFPMTKMYSRTKDFESTFRSALDACSNRLQVDDYAKFLRVDQDSSAQAGVPTEPDRGYQRPAVDLIPLTASPEMNPERSSLAAIAVCGLSESNEGRAKLRSYDQQLAGRLSDSPDDCSMLAMRCMIAATLSLPDAAERIEQLTSLVDKVHTRRMMRPYPFTKLMDLFSPALVVLSAEQPAVRTAGAALVDRLVAIARRREQRRILLTLTVAKLNALKTVANRDRLSDELIGLLDSLVPPSERRTVLSADVVEECLKIAEIAAQARAWDTSMEALQRGFGGGPAYRRSTKTDFMNPFASPPPRVSVGSFVVSSRSTAVARPNIQEGGIKEGSGIEKQLPRILLVLQQHHAAVADRDPPDPAVAYQALQEIVFPDNRDGEVYPYAANLLDQDSLRADQQPDLSPASVSASLVRAAVACGQADQLGQRLEALRNQSRTRRSVDLVRVQLAFALQDSAALHKAMTDLVKSWAVSLTTDSFKPTPRQNRSSPGTLLRSSSVPSLSTQFLEARTNALVHAILPVHARDGVTPMVAERERDLLTQASRHRSISNAGALWTWMGTQLIQSPTLSDSEAKQVVDLCLATVKRRYATRSVNAVRDQTRLQTRLLARSAIRAQRYTLAGDLLRSIALRNQGLQENDEFWPQVAIELSQLDAKSQVQILMQICGGDDEGLVSAAAIVGFVEPPPLFHSVLPSLEVARRVPVGHRDFPITSASLLLADAAARCEHTDPLIQWLRRQVGQPRDEAEAMVGQALLAADRIDEAATVLDRVATALEESVPAEAVKTPMPIESALLVARCLSVDRLRSRAATSWQHLLTHARSRNIGLPLSLLHRVAMNLEKRPADSEPSGRPLQHWISYQLPHHSRPAFAAAEPICFHRDGNVHLVAGADQNLLMLKYPLGGEFSFGHRNIYHQQGETHNSYGGTVYVSQAENPTLTVRTLDGRSTVHLANKAVKQASNNRNQIEVDKVSVRVRINGTELLTDQRVQTMPFVGLQFDRGVQAEVSDIKIDGDPIVLREVRMIDPQLRGWSCSILRGYLLDAHLPLGPVDNARKVRAKRETARRNAEAQTTWFASDGELRSGNRNAISNAGKQRHIQYARPLLDGESISYDFMFQAESQEVHPVIGRIVVLLRGDGVKLRWLGQDQSLESFQMDPLHEVEPDQILGDGRPHLREGEWNQVKLTREGPQVVVAVNGKSLCRFATSLDQRFGLLGEDQRECRIRNLTLAGPWPKQLPDVLTE